MSPAARLVPAALLVVSALLACRAGGDPPQPPGDEPAAEELARLRTLSARLKPLMQPLAPPEPGDWRHEHPERGQTFRQWLAESPQTARGDRRVLYVAPLGSMTATQRKVVDLSARFLGLYFQLPTKVLEPLPESLVPAAHQRRHPRWGMRQLHSEFILDEVLRPRVPRDAAALIAFTAVDLYPEPSWNFVFGQASLRDRVGVWSIHRKGDPERGPTEFRQVLQRTLRTATHETGHMLSIRHCTAWACNMCGSNSLEESDRNPLALCAECLPKLLYATRAYARARYRALEAFCREQGLEPERARYAELLAALGP
ncbi:MAG: archaemetzincin [Planctomycetota bacterium]